MRVRFRVKTKQNTMIRNETNKKNKTSSSLARNGGQRCDTARSTTYDDKILINDLGFGISKALNVAVLGVNVPSQPT